jgi:hypothetical protein
MLAATVVLAGCSSAAGGGTPAGAGLSAPVTASIPADPAVALAAAGKRLGTQSARFTVAYADQKQSGVIDPATRSWEIVGDGYTIRRIGDDCYVKVTKDIGMSADRVGKWIHHVIQPAEEETLTMNEDFPWVMARSAARGKQITRTGERAFRGKPSAKGTATSPYFVTELDSEGRFASVSVHDAANPPDPKYGFADPAFTFSDYGTPVTIAAPPPAEVVDDIFLLPAIGVR